jgi:hypothetical protein
MLGNLADPISIKVTALDPFTHGWISKDAPYGRLEFDTGAAQYSSRNKF